MKYISNHKGIALVYVIVVLLLGSILVCALLTVALGETTQSIYQVNNMKAYYIARAGADSMVLRLRTLNMEYWDDLSLPHETSEIPFGGGTIQVYVQRSGDRFDVVSTGSYNNAERQVKAVLSHNPCTKLDYALYAREALINLSFDSLTGQIGSGSTIGFENSSSEGSFRHLCEENLILNPQIRTPDLTEVLADIQMSPADNISISQKGDTAITSRSFYYENVLVSHGTWIIDTSAAEYRMKVDPMTDAIKLVDAGTALEKWMVVWIEDPSQISGRVEIFGENNLMLIINDALSISGPIMMSGSGRLEIHIIDESDDLIEPEFPNDINEYDLSLFSSQAVIGDSSDPDRIQINLYDGTTMKFYDNATLYGYILGPGAMVSLDGRTMLVGALYAQRAELTGSVSILYVPANEINLESIQFSYWE